MDIEIEWETILYSSWFFIQLCFPDWVSLAGLWCLCSPGSCLLGFTVSGLSRLSGTQSGKQIGKSFKCKWTLWDFYQVLYILYYLFMDMYKYMSINKYIVLDWDYPNTRTIVFYSIIMCFYIFYRIVWGNNRYRWVYLVALHKVFYTQMW